MKTSAEHVIHAANVDCSAAFPEGGKVSDELTVHVCGPSRPTCKCNCPESCEHVRDGPWQELDFDGGGGGGTVTCSRCGMTAMSHSLWVGP